MPALPPNNWIHTLASCNQGDLYQLDNQGDIKNYTQGVSWPSRQEHRTQASLQQSVGLNPSHGHSTNYFHQDYFDVAIGVNLTILLVLTTM